MRKLKNNCVTSIILTIIVAFPNITLAEGPSKDVKGSKDSALISRFKGASIIGYRQQDYDSFALPFGPYNADQKTHFLKSQIVEGRLTSIVYAVPEGKSALEVFRNYERSLAAAGFQETFECDAETCGGYSFATTLADPVINTMGGEFVNLAIDLLSATNNNVRSLTAHIDGPTGPVDVSLLVSQDDGKQVGVLLQTVEGRPIEAGQVTVDANAMSDGITKDGHVALYGIEFETDKANLTPGSDKTLEQMAVFLKQDATRKVYIVGHTDSTGDLNRNLDLSQARAAAVVKALVEKFGIAASRLQARGIGPYAPVASNENETGRAKNRRVELVQR
ncbi:OmpA family protein [Oryzifoliimicrobium ureilyticus]|uniref:OmpA family protein n=1 Tax=Oryzifoliimicrobium ureilyticus TaxID=3113724 RepID=UPI00307639A7